MNPILPSRFPLASVLALLFLLAGCVRPASGPRATFCVATNGNDAWSGTLASPNAERTDGPFATLERARDAVRALKKSGPLPADVIVEVRTGTYFHARPVVFSAEDSGTEATPIVYRAEAGGEVILTAGREVTGWRAVDDAAARDRLAPDVRDAVRVADLRAQGIEDWGKLGVRGFGAGNPPAEAELFCGDVPMTLARWPNAGFLGIKSAKNPLRVEVDTDRLARWVGEPEPWVFAYWHHDWAELYEPLAGVDPAARALLRTEKIKPVYGITAGRARWYAFNLLAELDQPGEYWIDRANGRLYFLPPPGAGRTVLSLGDGLLRAEKLAHVVFQGFTLEACRGTAVVVKDGENCKLVGCTIRNVGHAGVSVSGGTRHEVYGCDVFHCGEGGIFMGGGNRATLTPAGHNAENNHVHHYARRARTYKAGIAVHGVGCRIAHNLIHDGPHMALSAGGNDHLVEYNEIHNVVEESGDAGAYYVGRDWTQRGNVLRYNYWHQIVGATSFGGMTIYLDDQHGGHSIYGNLFERCSQSVFIGGGDDNFVTNNVFLACWKSAHIDNRGLGWQKAATDDPKGELRTRFSAMPVSNELWRTRYPTLAGTLQDEPGMPKRNVFAGNISAGGKWDDISQSIRAQQLVTNNLVFDDDPAWVRLTKNEAGQPARLEFKDPAAVEQLGFVPLPLEKMGLQTDPRRARWPVQHTVRLVKLPEAKPRK